VKEDKRRELEEAYKQLSRSEKIYVILYALGRVLRHRLQHLHLYWLAFQIKRDLESKHVKPPP
jgi:hypothetical protein